MEKQLDLVTNAKKQLIKLKYIEINIKSRCSIGNVTDDDVDSTSDCYYKNYPFPNFLYNYLKETYNPNPIERIISLNYKQEDYIYNLKLEDIPKSSFFSKKLKDFHFHNDIKCLIGDCHHVEYCEIKEEENVVYKSDLYSASALRDGKDFKRVAVVFENFDDIEKCEFSISYPAYFWKIFKSKSRLREIEDLIIKEIKESVPYAKSKNLANYHEKIFDFLSNRYEYNSEFVDINKAYLGQNVEKIYNLLLKENYNFGEKTQIEPIQNVFTFETYENLLKKFEKYGIKKLNLNIENRDKFILSWFDKFGSEYRKYCSELFGKDGKNYYDNVNNWTNKIELIYLLQILFGPKYWLEDLDFYPDTPDFLILPSWAKLKLENFEIFYLGGHEYGLFDEIISQFDSKKPVFWFKPYYYSAYGAGEARILPIALKNFILLNVDGQKIYYWFGHSNLYDDIYQGKYEILKYYFKQKLVKLEQDIFLRDGNDPAFFVSRSPRQNNLIKNVIGSSMEELILYRDALNKFLKGTDHEFEYFTDFLENTNLYTQQEKELILQPHLLFSWDSDDWTEYYDEIARVDFRGHKSKKFLEIKGKL
ncbi:hypothetical protein R7V45_00615 [Mesomycoplasma ovipneumoniae]|uniref:Uncharacterized protein n=1 Tax=Mesomycoplasma ovipneumoniae TaxID=29562 RepID=A0AAJ2P6Q5_9BACT|nr:hypothetical protein [Mesomycoplasma ovipneumoniae]MDW2852488.1 hypothetical protein [Mesomycoplasma ovipneumoniae]MDW2860721.1 hypothetical protein [Mesomycoplasma ovipneumoniae]MDW2861773.1 hypothetical protein [Mesomycoplasma ovipneumoniae]MDW2870637.1 hypothetical protein [Mesomycoplasma ovipneumoniae]MDW2891643.1 hypothetical protein [Mesomycoplasma ovipneumoniae]